MKAYTKLLLEGKGGCGHPAITLTTDHAQSSYGIPVAYIGQPDMVYGTGEILEMFGSCQVSADPQQLILAADEQDCPPKDVQAVIDAWNQAALHTEDGRFRGWLDNLK